jgi:hypothetical protein
VTGYFGQHADRLARAGYEVIPIIAKQKRPPFEGWQQGGDVAAWLPKYSSCSLGVLTRYTPALDIDVIDADLADDIQALADRVLGDAPVRYGLRPKRLMPFNLKGEPFAKVKLSWTLEGEAGAVECLASGQQFVCLGIHPDTGEPYAWERDPDLSLPRGLLPPLDQTRVIGFLKALADVMRKLGAVGLKARGWELEPTRSAPRPAKRYSDNETVPPWHLYSARELAQLIDPQGAHQHGTWWRCRCPAHNGKSHTSLVIRDAEGGPPGWHCFADCSDRDVATAIARIVW